MPAPPGQSAHAGAAAPSSEGPALRLGDEEIAERLDAGDAAHLLGIDEVAVERGHLHVAQHLGQLGVAVDGVVGQHADAGAGLDGDLQRRDVVDDAVVGPRVGGVAAGGREPVHGQEIGGLVAAEADEAVVVEVLRDFGSPKRLM